MGILKGTIKNIHSSINSIGGRKKGGSGGKKKTPGAGLLRNTGKVRLK